MPQTLQPSIMGSPSHSSKSFVTHFFFWLGWISGTLILGFILYKSSFYFLPVDQRVLHPEVESLKSSGYLGLSFGIAGTVMMFLNLGYLVRRHWIHANWMGPLRHWMSFHVFTGMIGGGLVLLHSTFLLRSAMGSIAFYALVIVIVTGLIGRYIYSRTPRSLEGKELLVEDIEKDLVFYQKKLEAYGIQPTLLQFADTKHLYKDDDHGAFATFFMVVFGDPVLKKNFETLKKVVLSTPQLKAESKALIPLAKKFCQVHQWFFRYNQLRSFMGSWRFFHKWFAIILLITIVFHVGLAMLLGDLWIFK